MKKPEYKYYYNRCGFGYDSESPNNTVMRLNVNTGQVWNYDPFSRNKLNPWYDWLNYIKELNDLLGIINPVIIWEISYKEFIQWRKAGCPRLTHPTDTQ